MRPIQGHAACKMASTVAVLRRWSSLRQSAGTCWWWRERGRRELRRGTVNLIGSGRDKAHEGRSHEGLCPRGHAGDLGPGLKGLGPGGSVLGGRAVIAAEVEEIVDPVMGGETPTAGEPVARWFWRRASTARI